MEGLGLIDQRKLDFLEAKLRVRARLSGETEGAVTLSVKGHKSEGRKALFVLHEAAHINAAALQGSEQHHAEGIHADFSEYRRAVPEIAERREKIGRRAARMCRHGRIAFHIFGFLRKINQHFSECHNFCHVQPPVVSPRARHFL